MFGLREWAEWNFLQFSVVLLQPIILFLLAVLVFPGPGARELDLRVNYFRQRPWFFGLLLLLLLVSISKDLIRSQLPEPLNVAFHAFFFVMSLAALASTRDAVHRGIGYATLLLTTLYITFLFAQLA